MVAMTERAELEQEYQRYLALRDEASVDWRRLADITALVAKQFMEDQPHGGDLHALQGTYFSATQKTREAVAQFRTWLAKQQGGDES
jgi:hypothetical protein